MSESAKFGAMQRLGLFGGSFDPVHLGHLLVAQAAVEELELCRLFFIPAAQSPFKLDQSHAPAAERVRLLRLALAGKTDCEVDEQEIQRGGVSYTVETLRDYARRFPQAALFYLIGADNVASLPQWREAGELAQLAEFVAIPRPGEVVWSAGFSRPAEPPEGGTTNFPAPFRGRTLTGFPLGVSSSQIRARVKAGRPIEPLVPPAVAEAIRNSQLYL
jgi:nicotinate-nucleotide adenylyltransferase